MSQTYGIEAARATPPAGAAPHEELPVRWVVLIESASEGRVARLFGPAREAVAELHASAPEVLLMTREIASTQGANGPEWDPALAGHSAAERAGAEIYELDA